MTLEFEKMRLNLSDLEHLKGMAIRAAKRAGIAINATSARDVVAIKKMAGSTQSSQVVTEADFESQRVILELLEPTCRMYDLALLSEEQEDNLSRLEKDYFWAIDPLDGTLPFIEQQNGYSVAISLVSRAGIPVIGVVYDPVTDSIFSALKGHGAFLNGKKISINQNVHDRCCDLVCDRSLKKHTLFSRLVEFFSREIKKTGLQELRTVSPGGAVMNACWALTHHPACFFKFPKKEAGGGCIWDFAATACIFQEAGGIVCDCFGEPVALNSADSVFMNEKGVIFATSPELKNVALTSVKFPCPHRQWPPDPVL